MNKTLEQRLAEMLAEEKQAEDILELFEEVKEFEAVTVKLETKTETKKDKTV